MQKIDIYVADIMKKKVEHLDHINKIKYLVIEQQMSKQNFKEYIGIIVFVLYGILRGLWFITIQNWAVKTIKRVYEGMVDGGIGYLY